MWIKSYFKYVYFGNAEFELPVHEDIFVAPVGSVVILNEKCGQRIAFVVS